MYLMHFLTKIFLPFVKLFVTLHCKSRDGQNIAHEPKNLQPLGVTKIPLKGK